MKKFSSLSKREKLSGANTGEMGILSIFHIAHVSDWGKI